MGHIHKMQDVNVGSHPPVIYPGSIERVDFGEEADDKFFVIATVQKQNTKVDFRQLKGVRPFITREVTIDEESPVNDQLIAALPEKSKLEGAVVRLVAKFSREIQSQIDESRLREYAAEAFEFHFIPRPEVEVRIRLPENKAIASLTPVDLTKYFWQDQKISNDDIKPLIALVNEVITEVHDEESET
jgi:exonuclease SbcD